jgi:hypothetical protein
MATIGSIPTLVSAETPTLLTAPAPGQAPRPRGRRRAISPESGRALEMLGHAIDYLADEFALDCKSAARVPARGIPPQILAIELLKARNREIYFNCPEVPTMAERLRALLHWQRA